MLRCGQNRRGSCKDIALLQEAQRPHGDGQEGDQVEYLSQALGYRHRVYFPNLARRGGRYGNAVLSRFPITESNHIAHVQRAQMDVARRASDHLPLIADRRLGP